MKIDLSMCALVVLSASTAFAQTKPAFEVATIKPAAPLDMAKVQASIHAGQAPKIGPHVSATQAEYSYMTLKDLIALSYGVKPYQVSGPDWLAGARFDILAKLPAGASKGDAPGMLQTLLEDRFLLTAHRTSAEHPVIGLVVGKGGPSMKEATGTPVPIDENAPLKPGEIKMDTPDGPIRFLPNKEGGTTANMGTKGIMTYKMNPAIQALHMDGDMVTMAGFADLLTQISTTGGGGRQIVDLTGLLKGYYQVSIDISMADLMNMARAAGTDVLVPAGSILSPTAGVAPDPGGMSFVDALQSMGLRLEQRKAMVQQVVVDHAEKSPSAN